MKANLNFRHKHQTKSLLIFLLAGIFTICASSKTTAQGNLLINPRRIVFEGQKKIAELNLANTGLDTARYVISIIEIRMTQDGSFEKIDMPDSGQNFADSYIRFFPRTVTLAPNEAQSVKIQLIKTNQLLPGEYRSHLYLRAVPDEMPLGENRSPKDPSTISVKLTPVFGISIPLIIKVGESTTLTNLSNASFEMLNDSIPVLNMVFNRTGNMSVYGDLKIDFISVQGKVTRVADIMGIAVYTPTSSRKLRVALDKTKGINYKTGKLHATYSTQADAKAVKIAETELVLL